MLLIGQICMYSLQPSCGIAPEELVLLNYYKAKMHQSYENIGIDEASFGSLKTGRLGFG